MDLRNLLTTRTPSLGQRALRGTLVVASWPYRMAIAIRNFAYDRHWKKVHRSSLPVISVGNLSVGGTGKSPAVAWIARWLRARGVRVAILSRGYGQLDSGQNDEALELELLLPDVPHLQHWDRVASAQLAEEELEMQVLVLDDGFQHRRIARDLEVVLLDATDSDCARRVLPGGLFREPMRSLKRAAVVLLTRTDQVTDEDLQRLVHRVQRESPRALVLQSRHKPARLLQFPNDSHPLSGVSGKRMLAFCAIGNPSSFFRTLEDLGGELIARRTWPDHHAFGAEDIAELEAWVARHPEAEVLVCTVKDWVKIQSAKLAHLDLLALVIELAMDRGQEQLEVELEAIVRKATENCG